MGKVYSYFIVKIKEYTMATIKEYFKEFEKKLIPKDASDAQR